jgi:hypothetical protein
MSKELKAYIIGINFSKYTLLTKIESYLKDDCKFEVEYVDWLGKKNIDIAQYEDGNIYIYVEVANIYKKIPYMIIEADEAKKSIANKFKILLEDIEKLVNSGDNVEEDSFVSEESISTVSPDVVIENTVDNSNMEVEEIIEEQQDAIISIEELPIVVNDNKQSSLCGINVIIDGNEYYISKADFTSLYELNNMLNSHKYKLSSIVVDNEISS